MELRSSLQHTNFHGSFIVFCVVNVVEPLTTAVEAEQVLKAVKHVLLTQSGLLETSFLQEGIQDQKKYILYSFST